MLGAGVGPSGSESSHLHEDQARQTNRREDYNIVRNSRVQQPTASSPAIQVQVSPLGVHVSSRTIQRHLAE
ncbi:hypothetical protein TNCV_3796301 [Trichonephila clavipes]|nr:hypothetical protein TNCV_3796301 [Trichonephila clavipes]